MSAFVDEDTEHPRAQIWSTATNPPPGPFEIRIDFSEPVVGMTADKLIVTNGAVDRLTDRRSARTEYSTTLWPERAGTVTVNLPAGTVTDDLGRPERRRPRVLDRGRADTRTRSPHGGTRAARSRPGRGSLAETAPSGETLTHGSATREPSRLITPQEGSPRQAAGARL